MKKIFLAFALLLLASGHVSAQFDEGPTETITVINAAQDNQDALSVGANPGDILRFEYVISSEFDLNGYIPVLNLSDFAGATVTDAGQGVFDGGSLLFPIIENGIAPIEIKHVFFARVIEQCGGATRLTVETQSGGVTTVGLNNCSQTGGEGSCYGPNGCDGDKIVSLPSTGPQTTVISLLLGIMGIFLIGFLLGRRV